MCTVITKHNVISNTLHTINKQNIFTDQQTIFNQNTNIHKIGNLTSLMMSILHNSEYLSQVSEKHLVSSFVQYRFINTARK